MEKVTLTFEKSNCAPLEVARGAALAEILDGADCPVFFGCKSGDCGTCLIELDAESFQTMPVPQENERETLETVASGKPFARLACQLHASTNLRITPGNA